jgi:hypothetical protein
MQHPYASFVGNVEKPARYLGGEYQSVNKDWNSVDVRVALAFPDVYDIGMSHLGTKILYSLLNKQPKILCERAFAPWVDMERELRARNLPLVTLESAHRLAEFDVVGISLQYEMTYTNVLTLLDLGGIALRAKDRDEDAPLVIGGGPVATHPEPVAPFFDAFLIGEAEEVLPDLLLAWARMKRGGVPRRERLIRLASRGGVYVPSLYTTTIDARTELRSRTASSMRACRAPSIASGCATSTPSRFRRTRRCRMPRRCSIACRSRSRAAAPKAAASARRA